MDEWENVNNFTSLLAGARALIYTGPKRSQESTARGSLRFRQPESTKKTNDE